MIFHFKVLGYASPQAMRADMATEQSELEAFVRFVRADPDWSTPSKRPRPGGRNGIDSILGCPRLQKAVACPGASGVTPRAGSILVLLIDDDHRVGLCGGL
jgi:hypothetical protein